VALLSGSDTFGTVAFGTEGGLFDQAGIPTVVCGPGSMDQGHKPDEFVSVEQLRGLRCHAAEAGGLPQASLMVATVDGPQRGGDSEGRLDLQAHHQRVVDVLPENAPGSMMYCIWAQVQPGRGLVAVAEFDQLFGTVDWEVLPRR
jgi:hypothetical protein